MRTLKTVVITFLAFGFLAAAGLFLVGFFKPKPGGILVNSTPASSVFINGNLVGTTPYEGPFEPGNVLIKLVPEVQDKPYTPYETSVSLISGVKTVVRREFGNSEELSSGDIVSFEKEGGKQAGLIVISDPDNAQVLIDGSPRGFAPFKTSNILVGEHQVTIKSPGFVERTLTINAVSGYKLTIFAKLARSTEDPQVETSTTEIKTFIEILDTPTGFLRVRSEPGNAGREIHQVKPGEKYLFLNEDSETGWYQIELESPKVGLPGGRSGWVSNEYSQKIEEEVSLSPVQ